MALRASGLLLLAVVAIAPFTRADLLPDGKKPVPLALTLEGADKITDGTIVLDGCSSDDGRHYFQIVKVGSPTRCGLKRGADAYIVPKSEVKPLEDLQAKNVGRSGVRP